MIRPGIEPWSFGPLANTLTIIPMSGEKVNTAIEFHSESNHRQKNLQETIVNPLNVFELI